MIPIDETELKEAVRLAAIEMPARRNLLGLPDQAMKEREAQTRDQVVDRNGRNNGEHGAQDNKRNQFRRDGHVRRIRIRRGMTMGLAAATPRHRIETAAEALRNHRNQGELQIGSQLKGPE